MLTRKILSLMLCLVMLSAAAVSLAETESIYPLDGGVTLTYFGKLHSKVAKVYPGWESLDVVQDWFKATGVTLQFQCPPAGMEEEQFNMMLASGEYTDIINYDFKTVTGGLTKLYEDGVIIDLTPYLPDYAPNYWAWLNNNPEAMKEIMDDEGRILCFPFAKGGGVLLTPPGPILREDILAELGLETPLTIDQWEETLLAVKAAYPDMVPFTGSMTRLMCSFAPAFLISNGEWYYTEDYTAHYAPLEDGFVDFITRMASWFEMGLIDPDIMSIDDTSADNKMSAGLAFSSYGAGGAQVAAYVNANKDNPGYSTIGVSIPTLQEDDTVKYVSEWPAMANPQFAVSTKCKDIESALRMYDWAYTEEGYLRLNWGIEGVSYTVNENGERHFTDLILNNPDGLSVDAALANYALPHVKGPCSLVQDQNYMLDYYALDQQKRSMINWTSRIEPNSYRMPSLSYINDESARFTNLMADIDTYYDTMVAKFILGQESLDNIEAFRETLYGMGLEEALTIQQDATTRFFTRGE